MTLQSVAGVSESLFDILEVVPRSHFYVMLFEISFSDYCRITKRWVLLLLIPKPSSTYLIGLLTLSGWLCFLKNTLVSQQTWNNYVKATTSNVIFLIDPCLFLTTESIILSDTLPQEFLSLFWVILSHHWKYLAWYIL